LFTRGADQIQALKVGDPIPDLTLQGSDGKEHSFRKICADGSGVIVAWIPKTGTPG
jgi:peroxiredoxin